jgi:endonuclease V-like protein UPF0215 family
MTESSPKRRTTAKIREVKPEIRILGIDDGPFTPHSNELVDVIGVVFRGGQWLDGFMHTKVQVDGMDATEKLVMMVNNSPHSKQLRVIMLNGVTLAGFNVVDIGELCKKVHLPVVAITREKPNFDDIKRALQNLNESKQRWKSILKAGKIIQVCTHEGQEPIYAHITGMSEETAKRILKRTSTRSNIPEALRVAHIIASGLKQC